MLTRPNPSSGVPVYTQLVDQLAHAIATGAVRSGESLPAIGRLAEELVIHPGAVVRAYQVLEAKGIAKPAGPAGAWLATATPSAGDGGLARRTWLDDRRSRAEILADLANARDVQQRLLPQDYAAVDGLDYAGASRAAFGVGGDYFDFIRASDHELGIAIGDVSGKGVPAALLMATLRGYLRSQLLSQAPTVVDVILTLNRLVYESSAANRYATFFYGQYDTRRRVLTYVNAGHNPPLVLRAADGAVVRLDPCGPVIGLIERCAYVERTVVLEPGDTFVAYTDGITDAMAASGDEWGEQRLVETATANRTQTARRLVDTVIRSVDLFVGGAPQHDDMTVIAVRID